MSEGNNIVQVLTVDQEPAAPAVPATPPAAPAVVKPSSAKFELKVTPKGNWMFNLKARNGEVVLTSEKYEARKGAANGIESVRKNAAIEKSFDIRKAKNGEHYFVLVARNKEIIGKSEMYKSMAAVKRGIASVMKNAPTARLVELAAPVKKAAKAAVKAPAAKALAVKAPAVKAPVKVAVKKAAKKAAKTA